MKKYLLILGFIFCFVSVRACAATFWVNDLRELFLHNKAVILVVNPRTMGADDKNKNDIIEFDKKEISGNFVNAISRLDSIKAQGFNTIHILPFTPVGERKALGTAGSLYALNGFDSINPQLDDKTNKLSPYQELRNFVNECHKRGIRVIADIPSCGSYDLFLTNPGLFALDENQKPIIPSDWVDVRLFKTKNPDGSLNLELLDYHKKFIDMILALNIDGLRADCAALKPFEFWSQLIKYTRQKSPQFLFLAESSPSWTQKICKECEFTSAEKLLEAGFDGHYGNYVNYFDFKSSKELLNEVENMEYISKKLKTKKATIGSFATHDILSPVVSGGSAYASQILWLGMLMPTNPYFVDGFQTLDPYIYQYSNQKAEKTFTDDDYYYVHKGKMDIFNFSRCPKGNNNEFYEELLFAQKIRLMLEDLPNLGSFKLLSTNDSNVFAFIREFKGVKVIVILNKENTIKTNVITRVKGISSEESIFLARLLSTPTIANSKIKSELKPYEIQVYVWMPKSKSN